MAYGLITPWQIVGEKVESVIDFLFLGSKITAEGDCSHEIRRLLLLGRKAMTNLMKSETEICSVVSNSLQSHRLYSPWNSPGQDIGVGSHSRLQGFFPTQGSNPGLPHCKWILYHLNHQGSPKFHICKYK